LLIADAARWQRALLADRMSFLEWAPPGGVAVLRMTGVGTLDTEKPQISQMNADQLGPDNLRLSALSAVVR
jgi:hypothetical protein